MNADNNHEAIYALTATIIGAAHTISNALGTGLGARAGMETLGTADKRR